MIISPLSSLSFYIKKISLDEGYYHFCNNVLILVLCLLTYFLRKGEIQLRNRIDYFFFPNYLSIIPWETIIP